MDLKDTFPIFKNNPNLVYLDHASSSLKTESVLAAIHDYDFNVSANVHRGLYPLAEEASSRYEAVRNKVQGFLNTRSPHEIVFTSGTTASLNLIAYSFGSLLKPGDEIILTVLEHHANLVPWQLLAKCKELKIHYVPILEDGCLDMRVFHQVLSSKTKLVSCTGLSNILGTKPDIKAITTSAHAVGAKMVVDAAQLVSHEQIDVQDLDIDFLVFSSHKIYGPTGAGVLYAKSELLELMPPWMAGGDMISEVHLSGSTWNKIPWKFEAGTPPIAAVIGMGAAIDFIQELSWEKIQSHELELENKLFDSLKNLDYIKIFGPKPGPSHRGAFAFVMPGVHPHDIASRLGERHICIRAGQHCCMPLHEALKVNATARVSFGVYNEPCDIDTLLLGLDDVKRLFL